MTCIRPSTQSRRCPLSRAIYPEPSVPSIQSPLSRYLSRAFYPWIEGSAEPSIQSPHCPLSRAPYPELSVPSSHSPVQSPLSKPCIQSLQCPLSRALYPEPSIRALCPPSRALYPESYIQSPLSGPSIHSPLSRALSDLYPHCKPEQYY
ncbi:unnamed protein product [Gadus morhua 'NCC']